MNTPQPTNPDIKAIIGLGNPGKQYELTRHNIGFRVVDQLARDYHGTWQSKPNMDIASINLDGKKIILIKPQTFMNSSGKVISELTKQGIKPEHILVVHDELEMPFAKIAIRFGGSARGHNGLKSIIQACGPDFFRLRWGIARPEDKAHVPDYVLKPFMQNESEIERGIQQAITALVLLINKS
ncbi:peptidyl-tRNA hydrolase [Candidatus Dependentiae bacterium Noda2021]|nr:peptidyl-tRNA hydrolase [Candidatus Dependentiae bacterium Noda2021]